MPLDGGDQRNLGTLEPEPQPQEGRPPAAGGAAGWVTVREMSRDEGALRDPPFCVRGGRLHFSITGSSSLVICTDSSGGSAGQPAASRQIGHPGWVVQELTLDDCTVREAKDGDMFYLDMSRRADQGPMMGDQSPRLTSITKADGCIYPRPSDSGWKRGLFVSQRFSR